MLKWTPTEKPYQSDAVLRILGKLMWQLLCSQCGENWIFSFVLELSAHLQFVCKGSNICIVSQLNPLPDSIISPMWDCIACVSCENLSSVGFFAFQFSCTFLRYMIFDGSLPIFNFANTSKKAHQELKKFEYVFPSPDSCLNGIKANKDLCKV